jgi:hypothetical protein
MYELRREICRRNDNYLLSRIGDATGNLVATADATAGAAEREKLYKDVLD